MTRCRRTVVSLVLLGLGAVGCGEPASEPARGAGVADELPGEVVERLNPEPPGRPAEIAVAGSRLLVVGGSHVSDDDALVSLWDDALVVDLDSGDVTRVPAPSADLAVVVTAAVADSSGFVAVGLRCRLEESISPDDFFCSPGAGTAFTLPADGSSWTEVAFPDDVSPSRTDEPWTFDVHLALSPTGETLGTLRSGPSAPGPKPIHVLALRNGAWEGIAELPDVQIADVCAAGQSMFVLAKSGSGADGADSAKVTLTEVPLDGEAPRDAPLPDVDASFSGASVALGCDDESPYVTSTQPELASALRVWRRVGLQWEDVPGDWDAELQSRSTSAPGAWVLTTVTTKDAERLNAYVLSGGTSRRLAPELASALFTPALADGGLVGVGPLPYLALEIDGDEAPGSVTAVVVKP